MEPQDLSARLLLLGTPQLQRGREVGKLLPDTLPGYLLAYLAHRADWVPREELATLCWPEASDAEAMHNLRVNLSRLRPLLRQWQLEPALVAERRRLRVDLTTDTGELRQATDQKDWTRAARLPNGVFLQGLTLRAFPVLGEWARAEREAWLARWREAMLAAAPALDAEAVGTLAARYRAHDPLDEEVLRLELSALVALGRADEARRRVERHREQTQAELDQQPSAAFEAFASGLLAEGSTRNDPGRAPPPSTRPTEASGLLGRATELRRLDDLTQAYRWVTVAGLAGTGKSMLVRHWLAGRATVSSAMPAVRIDITGQSRVPAIVETIATALSYRPAAAVPFAAGEASHLARLTTLQGLLVFDGLDPNTDDIGLVAMMRHVVEHCPGLRVVATSRTALGLAGEEVLRLQGLSTERADDHTPSAAARLFLREAQRVHDGQAWAASNAERIAALCAGLPLALKLAASLSRWVGAERLADELRHAVRADERALDPSLHAWLQAPWQHLPASQQRVLAMLSLFPGQFDMQSAVAVAGEAVGEVEALIESCLLDVDGGAPPQLHLHPLVRAFAAGQLRKVPTLRRDAIARFLSLVNALLGPRRIERGHTVFEPKRVAIRIDELHEAWSLAVETGALNDLSWLADALHALHEAMGDWRAGAKVLADGEGACDASLPAEGAVLARIQVARATLTYRAGDYDGAAVLADSACVLAERTGQRGLALLALHTLGLSCWMRLQHEQARAIFTRGLAMAAEDEDRPMQSRLSSSLALVEKSLGHFEAAESAWRQAIEFDREIGDWKGVCTRLNNLSNLMRHTGRFDDAEALALECLRLSHEHGLPVLRAFALIGLALLHHAAGRAEQAEPYLELLDSCPRESVEAPVRAGAAQLRALIALDREQGDEARSWIAKALRTSVGNDDKANRAEALALHGRWLLQHGGRRDEAIGIWAALVEDDSVHATLKDEVRALLLKHGLASCVAAAPRVDLVLVVERILAAAISKVGLV